MPIISASWPGRRCSAWRCAGQEKRPKELFGHIADALTQVVRWIIACAPVGILGLVYSAVSENGLGIFTEYGRLLLLLVGCMLFIALVVNPLIVFCNTRKNPYPLVLKCLKESGITAFSRVLRQPTSR